MGILTWINLIYKRSSNLLPGAVLPNEYIRIYSFNIQYSIFIIHYSLMSAFIQLLVFSKDISYVMDFYCKISSTEDLFSLLQVLFIGFDVTPFFGSAG